MNADNFRVKTVEDLQNSLIALLKSQFELRMQFGSGQLTKHHQIRNNRKDIARIKTVLTEKSRTENKV